MIAPTDPRTPRVVLVGPPGAGKSTIGRKLAKELGVDLYDTDAGIERETGRTIPEIFAEDGEPAFRALERLEVAALSGPVVADLGGGAFCQPANAERLLAVGRVVFLDVSEAEAARRIGGGEGRPLASTWAPLLARRRPLYGRAHLRVEVDGLGPEAVARRILGML